MSIDSDIANFIEKRYIKKQSRKSNKETLLLLDLLENIESKKLFREGLRQIAIRQLLLVHNAHVNVIGKIHTLFKQWGFTMDYETKEGDITFILSEDNNIAPNGMFTAPIAGTYYFKGFIDLKKNELVNVGFPSKMILINNEKGEK